jgi:hypothetical protein
MPRFAVLEHDHPTLHWDLFLEAGDVLRSWRLTAPPRPDAPFAAEATADHRKLYLDYEGPVSGGRGRVVRWDAGSFDWLEATDEVVRVSLQGGRLVGVLELLCAGSVWRGRFVVSGG